MVTQLAVELIVQIVKRVPAESMAQAAKPASQEWDLLSVASESR